jgi:hypothetical protein
VLTGYEGTRVYSGQNLLYHILLGRGRGVVLLDEELFVLIRDPYFTDQSHLFKYVLRDDLKFEGSVSLEGIAYDVVSDGRHVAVATGDYIRIFDAELNEVGRVNEGAFSVALLNDRVYYVTRGHLKCTSFK